MTPIKDTEVFLIESKKNHTLYTIDVFLPKSYNSSTKNYPVVFIFDAEYNFGMVAYGTRRLIKDKLIPEVILVGIENDTTYDAYTSFRQRDYTPTKTIIPSTGGGELFLNFIKDELIPEVKSKYRVKDDRTIVGHSLGGLIGFYTMIKRPEIFNRYLLVSPSLWYDDKLIFKLLNKASNSLGDNTSIIYTSIGELETIKNGQVNDMVEDLKQFTSLLSNKNIKYKAEVLANETHRTVFPRAFMNGMRVIFGN